MRDRYTIGGYGGPSEQRPRDRGGSEVHAPEALPFKPLSPGHRRAIAQATEPRIRRQLVLTALTLVVLPLAAPSPGNVRFGAFSTGLRVLFAGLALRERTP